MLPAVLCYQEWTMLFPVFNPPCGAIPRVVCSVRDFRDFRVTPAPDSPFNATRFLFHSSFLPCPKSKRIREVQEENQCGLIPSVRDS